MFPLQREIYITLGASVRVNKKPKTAMGVF
jgi:hypothetical protein